MIGAVEAVFRVLDAGLAAIPLSAARWIVVAFLSLAMVGALGLDREFVFRGAPARKWYLDLRLWAAAFMLPYVLIYLFF